MATKKVFLYSALGIGVLALIIAAVFAARMHHGCDGHHSSGGHHNSGSHHKYGFGGLHRMGGKRMVARLSRWFDLTPAQRDALHAAADETGADIRDLRRQLKESRRTLRDLDPRDAGYGADIAELAEKHGRLAARMTIRIGDAKTTLSEILTEAQMEELMEWLE